jgi:hypothetical protein
MNATTTLKPAQPAMLSASGLSRKADVPLGKILRAIQSGALSPDSVVSNRLFLFHPDRVGEVKQRIETLSHQPAELAVA